jgi:hypothetical protein
VNLAVLSFFRNAAHGQAQHFMQQVAVLRDCWKGELRVIAVYGDCTDNTAGVIALLAIRYGLPLQLIECSHGGPVFGSTEATERMVALSKIANAGLDALYDEDDLIWYVESDLIWTPGVVESLATHIIDATCDAVAPLVFAGPAFYDIYSFRKNGRRFFGWPPYHHDLNGQALNTVDSVGSAFVMAGDVGRNCRIRHGDALIGFFKDVMAKGYKTCVDTSLRVEHPT